ncbi:maleylpyruvate isomerase N-terminal domain-containing protein [Cryptosporangium sp. NPDC048952]|uniref:maleylpyruvate isomerase N-terminal domain-containing protein n=1 Tax=Cryptosporangium sp. NPDC048952 TaxID=3363961 RepID=UPI0037130AE0
MDTRAMNAEDLERAVEVMSEVLRPALDDDWSVPAGVLEWSCRETLAHIAHDLFAYAAQLAGRRLSRYLPQDLVMRAEATTTDVLAAAEASGALLTTTIRAADPETRAWHYGPCDPCGFAALGVAEILVHTHDITQGLGIPWHLPAELGAAALRRLAPDADPDLLRYTGRLGDVGEWHWHAARPDQ